MEDYLRHWWEGDLGQYSLWGLTISQLNLVAKTLQYAVGFAAILEIIEFVKLMRGIRTVTWLYFVVTGAISYVINLPNIIARLLLAILLAMMRKMSIKQAFSRSLIEHIREAKVSVTRAANYHPIVAAFAWLERHPISEKGRKIMIFVAFVLLSLLELLTTT